jgi:hypothetical protein
MLAEEVEIISRMSAMTPGIAQILSRLFGITFPQRASRASDRAVHHLMHGHRAFVAATLARRDQGFNQYPFVVRQVTRIA